MDQFRGAYQQGLLAEGVDPNSFDPYGLAATGLLFAPGSGVADVAGYAPSMTTPGEYEPSMMANIGSGQYMDAGLQGLGLLGDAFMAAGTVVPPLIPVGAAMKLPRAGRVASNAADIFPEVKDFPSLTKSEERVVAASSAPPEQVAGLGRIVTEPIDPKNMEASRTRFNELQKITSGYEQERAKARIVRLDDGTDAIQYMEPPATVQSVPISQLKATQPGLISGGDAPITEGPPLVVKKSGEFFVRDGHHRLARMIEAGADVADVRLVDLDAGGLLGVDAPRAARVAGRVGGYVPQKTVKAYKLFKTDKKGNLYPLFVKMRGNEPIPVGEWTRATAGEINPKTGKVKSSLGDLAYRPGFHAGDAPSAKHIGGKLDPETGKPTRKGSAPNIRKENQVWAEVEYPADVDWQSIADERAVITKAGTPNLATAHITDEVPYGGFYRYKTNPNMEGNWLISGDMKVNKILSDKEVKAVNKKAGTSDLPRAEELVRQYRKSRGLLEM